MIVKYSAEARRDAAWWRLYYRKTFPEGRGGAFRHLRVTERMIEDYPEIGTKIPETEWRKLNIPRTPFVFVYQIKQNFIEIVRVYDMRQGGSNSFQED